MFCPNCGTQNSETASTCTKCGFNLKGAAAPKFKGTMLMNQSPPVAPPPGAPQGAPPPGAPRPGMPPVQPMNPGLAGTVVGVPPAGLGAMASAGAPPAPPAPPAPAGYGAPPAQQYGAPPAANPYGAPPAQQYGAPPAANPYGAPPGAPQGGYSPPGPPQGGVNPLGGTMAIDQMPNFAAGGPAYGAPAAAPGAPPNPYGAPPPQQPGAFGAPAAQPGFPPPQGAPPGGGFGAPPDQGMGGQQPYGAPPQQPYGAPPQQPYGAPPQQQPYGAPPGQGPGYGGPTGQEIGQAANQFGAAAGGMIQAGLNAQPGAGPSQRNPVKTLLICWGVFFVINIIGNVLAGIVGVGLLGSLFSLAGFIAYGFMVKPMLMETQTAANNQDFKWWWQLVPILQIYFDVLKVPELITAAKTQRGILQQKPTRSLVFYLFLFPYALALDLNDLAPPGPPA